MSRHSPRQVNHSHTKEDSSSDGTSSEQHNRRSSSADRTLQQPRRTKRLSASATSEGQGQGSDEGQRSSVEEQKKILPKKRLWQPPASSPEHNFSSAGNTLLTSGKEASSSNFSTEDPSTKSTLTLERKRKLAVASLPPDHASSLPFDFSQKTRQFSAFTTTGASSAPPPGEGDEGAMDLSVMSTSSTNLSTASTSTNQSNNPKAGTGERTRAQSCPSGPVGVVSSLGSSNKFSIAFLSKSEASTLTDVEMPTLPEATTSTPTPTLTTSTSKEESESESVVVKEDIDADAVTSAVAAEEESPEDNQSDVVAEEAKEEVKEELEKVDDVVETVDTVVDKEEVEEDSTLDTSNLSKDQDDGEESSTVVNFVRVDSFSVNPEEFIKSTVEDFLIGEKEERKERRLERVTQIDFLSQLGLITPYKKQSKRGQSTLKREVILKVTGHHKFSNIGYLFVSKELVLDQIVRRIVKGTVAPLKFRPSYDGASKVSLLYRRHSSTSMTPSPPSMSTVSTMGDDRLSYLGGLGLRLRPKTKEDEGQRRSECVPPPEVCSVVEKEEDGEGEVSTASTKEEKFDKEEEKMVINYPKYIPSYQTNSNAATSSANDATQTGKDIINVILLL